MLARAREALDHAPTAGLLPHPLKGEARGQFARLANIACLAAIERVETMAFCKPRSRAKSLLEPPRCLQLIDPSQRGDHLLAHFVARAPAMDDLQIGVAPEVFLPKYMGGSPAATYRGGAVSAFDPQKSTKLRTDHGIQSSRCADRHQ